MPRKSWTVRVSGRAQADIQAIRRWTQHQFGDEQELTYARLIVDTLDELRVRGIESVGVKPRDEITTG